jgi:hypothetical protein
MRTRAVVEISSGYTAGQIDPTGHDAGGAFGGRPMEKDHRALSRGVNNSRARIETTLATKRKRLVGLR